MRFSLQVHYAICGVFDLAYNGQGEPVQVRVIGERQEIPTRYLEQIFQRLRRANLVTGKRGPGGGYVLGRPSKDISLLDIVEAVEGPIGGVTARAGEAAPRSRKKPMEASTHPDFLWGELADRFGEVLAGFTLDELCRRAASQGVRRYNADVHNYEI